MAFTVSTLNSYVESAEGVMTVALRKEPNNKGMSTLSSAPRTDANKAVLEDASPERLAELSSAWGKLVAADEAGEPFLQPYWSIAFAKTFGHGRKLKLVVVEDGNDLQAILPLMRSRSFFGGIPAETLQSLSGLHSCRYDLVCPYRDRSGVAKAVWSALRQDKSWDVIEARNVPQQGRFEAIMREAEADGFLTATWPTLLSPYLEFPNERQDPFRNCPQKYSKARARLEKVRQKLMTLGQLDVQTVRHFDERTFSDFLALEASGWKGKNGGAIRCNPTAVRFYELALKEAADAGHLRMHSLTLNGKPIAMEIGLWMDGCFYSPKVTYDESFSKYSPGQLLMKATLTQLAADGVRGYDFLGPRARHKYFWTSKVREHAHCYIFRPSLAGRLRRSIVTSLAPQLRRVKHSLYGDPQGGSGD